METLYFTLGIASVVVTVIAVVAVWAMFKVAKLSQTIQELERSVNDGLNSTHRDITMVDKTIMNSIDRDNREIDARFNEISRETHLRIDSLQVQLDHAVNELYRHVDSRVDKLAAKQEKQLIKG
jgi:predicted PurR-regulated permease PerM